MNNEARIMELENRVAHQDQALMDLSDEIYRQQQQITRLEDRSRQLLVRVEALATAGPAGDPSDEVPPHY
ncbi:MAG: SlyX family protein [Gammaproteobacteria bacterium]|nr:SlyX family protein [Gammaproteobacteria bacterium]